MDLPVKAVLFDLDDTLFDHRAAAREALEAVRENHSRLLEVPLEDLERTCHALLEELHVRVLQGRLSLDQARLERFQRLFALHGVDAKPEIAAAAAGLYRKAYLAARRSVPGALDLLKHLKGAVSGLQIGIVTNNTVSEQRGKLDHLELTPWIDHMVVSEEAGVQKPDPRIFDIALRRMGRSGKESVMVGDSWESDVLGARNAGIRAVWFNRLGLLPPQESGSIQEIGSLQPAEDVAALLLSARERT